MSGTVLSRRRRRLGTLVLDDRTVAADPAETASTPRHRRWPPIDQPGLDRRGATAPGARRPAACGGPGGLSEPVGRSARRHRAGTGWRPTCSASHAWRTRPGSTCTSSSGGLLGWEHASRLDRDLPTHLALPNGRAAIDYTQPVPLAAARAQAFYGQTVTPRCWPAAGCRCSSPSCRRPDGRLRSPPTWPVSGKAPGRMCGGTCGGGIRGTTGRKSQPDMGPDTMCRKRALQRSPANGQPLPDRLVADAANRRCSSYVLPNGPWMAPA